MEAVFGEGPFEGALRASGILIRHHVDGPDGELVPHEGDIDACVAPECQWPRLRGMVTLISGGRPVTGSLVAKNGNTAEVTTADGALHRGLLATVTRPEWGVYCPHGTKLVEREPAEHVCKDPWPPCDLRGQLGHLCGDHHWCRACYPTGRKISPWPCGEDGCTEADFDREQQEMEEAYYEEMRREAYGY